MTTRPGRPRRRLGAVVAAAVALGACGSDDAPTPLVAPSETITTNSVAPFPVDEFQAPSDFALPDPLPGSGAAAGSGCGLEESVGDILTDGVWLVRIVGGGDQDVVVDLACGFQDPGTPACTVAFVDWCARDSTDRLRDQTIGADPLVRVVNADATALVPGLLPDIGDAYVWIAVNDGDVTQATEQRV